MKRESPLWRARDYSNRQSKFKARQSAGPALPDKAMQAFPDKAALLLIFLNPTVVCLYTARRPGSGP